MLDSEDVAMQVCDPLPALRCEVQIAQGRADIRLDTLPEECWIGNDQIGWTRQSKLFGGSSFHELIEQRIQLFADSEDRPTDRSGRRRGQGQARYRFPGDRSSSGTGKRVNSIARAIRSPSNTSLCASRSRTNILHPRHMIWGQHRVAGAARQLQPFSSFINDRALVFVSHTHATHISNVMAQRANMKWSQSEGRTAWCSSLPLRMSCPTRVTRIVCSTL